MSKYILPLIGALFVILASFHYVKALNTPLEPNGNWCISKKVRLRLAVIFGIVGIALIGLRYFMNL